MSRKKSKTVLNVNELMPFSPLHCASEGRKQKILSEKNNSLMKISLNHLKNQRKRNFLKEEDNIF
jgi:hypothetical protein